MSTPQDSAQASGSSSSSSSSVNVNQVKTQIANKFQANKPLVLKLHSILTWEQDVYPILVSAFVTFSFLIIYLMNSSILTTFSYIGMAVALIDLAMPTIAKNLCGGSSSSATAKLGDKDNQRFDKICMDLAKVYAFFRESCNMCCSMKTSKPKLYYPSVLGTLLVLAYIGNKINNLFLTYLVTLFIALYPGLERKGFTQKAVEFVYSKLGRRPPGASAGGDRRSSGKRN